MPLRVRSLSYAAGGKQILDQVSFELGGASRTVILGPNGAGKSVLLKLCHGLLRPAAGEVRWAGRAPDEARRRQGMVFQRPVLLRRSVAGNLLHALGVRGVPRARRNELVAAALRAAGLTDKARQSARTLSGGEQQRLAIARAWVLKPDVLLLDEPTANLDPEATRAIEDLILTFEAAGTRVIMTTHDIGQARRLANDVIFLNRGRLLEHSPAERFFAAPRDPAAARFIGGALLA
ncbi:MAG TPA: phosphate ABC transporter ATP-binding protein [Gammaproteobacteria bacterium]|nr:phosphate ABC transporter ATP-binding protein [Gammaproteobacteria bacterium]